MLCCCMPSWSLAWGAAEPGRHRLRFSAPPKKAEPKVRGFRRTARSEVDSAQTILSSCFPPSSRYRSTPCCHGRSLTAHPNGPGAVRRSLSCKCQSECFFKPRLVVVPCLPLRVLSGVLEHLRGSTLAVVVPAPVNGAGGVRGVTTADWFPLVARPSGALIGAINTGAPECRGHPLPQAWCRCSRLKPLASIRPEVGQGHFLFGSGLPAYTSAAGRLRVGLACPHSPVSPSYP